MRELKHLPVNEWPEADREAFRAAYEPGDVFDETAGPGAQLAPGTRDMIKVGYRRWLGFLKASYPDDLSLPPAERIKPARIRGFIEHLSAESKPAIVVQSLYAAAKLIAPTADWTWLKSVKSRLGYRAWPEDRFDRLVAPLQTLDFGSSLWTPHFNYRSALTSNVKLSIATGCCWRSKASGPCAVAAWPPSPSAVILSSMMQG